MEVDLKEGDPVTTYKYNFLIRWLHRESSVMGMSDEELCNFLLSCAVGIIARGSLEDDSRLEDDMDKLKQAVDHIRNNMKAERDKSTDEV